MRRAFTLIEAMVVLGVTGLLTLMVGTFAVSIIRTTRSLNATLTANEQARRAVLGFVQELRTAAVSSNGAYPIAEAGANTITFYSNIDSDSAKERLRYFVNGTTLRRGVLKPTGQPLTYNPANEVVRDAVTNLTNPSSIFSYFDTNYNGQTPPLTIPPSLTVVRVVRIHLSVDAQPMEAPAIFDISSDVSLRNLKDNL